MDHELAQIIAQLADEARLSVRAEIPGFLALRKITSLFHFTSVHNLESLVTEGFLGRDSLKQKNIPYVASDNHRIEPLIDGICFSLSRPNIYMAAQKIQNGGELVLLELSDLAQILTNYNFVASPGNFGSPLLKNKIQNNPEQFIGSEGLLNLFQEQKIRDKFLVPEFEPTDPQAEIIILESLPWNYVQRIYFPDTTDYSISEKIRKIVRILPKGIVLQSQIKKVFPAIDWRNPSVVKEYRERKWSENWTHSQ